MPVVLFMDSRALRALDKDMQDLAIDLAGSNRMRQPLQKIADKVLAPSIDKNFAVGGRPKKWEEVGTNAYRAKKGVSDARPLWVTGKLKRAATRKARFKIKNNTLTYGYFPNMVWFAVVHDNAKLASKTNIPQRPFALIQSEDVTDSIRIFGDWVESRVNRHIKRFYV